MTRITNALPAPRRAIAAFAVAAMFAAVAFAVAPAVADHAPWGDVPDAAPEGEHIDWVHDNGIYAGYGNCASTVGAEHLLADDCEGGEFGYRDGISRDQMAVVLKNLDDNVTQPAIADATTYDLQADGPYPGHTQLTEGSNSADLWPADDGAELHTSWVECADGKVATGGGFSPQHGADDLGATGKDLQIVTSAPMPGPAIDGDPDGSVVPVGWVVKGYNHGADAESVRPHVICVDLALAG